MRTRTVATRAIMAAILAAACSNAGKDGFSVQQTGTIQGRVSFDVNGSGAFEQGTDTGLAQIGLRLVAQGTRDTIARASSGAAGAYTLTEVPVGTYVLAVDASTFADTIQVEKIDSTTFSVPPGGSVTVNVELSYPRVSTAAARTLAQGRHVFVVGVALNGAATFADSSVALADTSGSLRLTQVRATFQAGDSLRILGTTAQRSGEPTLDSPTVYALGQGHTATAATLTTGLAASAASGARDAQLVSVSRATISDTARTSNSFVLTVSDGSGPLQVQLDRTADAAFQTANLPGNFVPGNKFDMLGVLVPTGTGSWRLRPRSAADLTLIPLPVSSIAAARALPAGLTVSVVGVALNSSTTFSDTTVHLTDSSGAAIRLTRLSAAVAASDSFKVAAITSSRAGQPTLDAGTITAFPKGHIPTATTLTTAAAASAAGATRDAQLVSVSGATISDTVRTSTSFVLTVNDGSGPLQVQLDQTADAAFQTASLPGNYIPGNTFNLLGVLVPTGSGTWRLRPRSAADLTLIPLPVISIATARALPAGQTALVVGVALNNSTTFADTTVFLVDTSAAIRLTRLSATVAAGDSVKIRATRLSRAGQPTLDAGTSTPFPQKGHIPTATTLTTAAAATAASATLDAQLVSVLGGVISDTSRTSTSFLLTVNDGSGPLVVQLDQTAGFVAPTVPGVYVPGNRFNLLGVLAPTGTGTWQLKPRSPSDLTLIPLPVISIRAARALSPGQVVAVVGVALNNSGTFSDTTVHLADTSGAIRLTRLKATQVTGDLVKITAVTSSRADQPTLDAGTSIPLGTGLLPTAPTLTTAVAATAQGGALDAQLVVINNATITATATVVLSGISYYSLTVSDGSGNLQVLLDPKAGFVFPVIPGTYLRGYRFNIIGVLVPTGTGSWMLKPRSTGDLSPLSSVITVKAARALPPGQTVIVMGVALNGSSTFSDATVHLIDSSAAVRITRLQGSAALGDSVQITAVTATQAGQPTLDSATSTLISAGHTLYAPTLLTTSAAAGAASGTRDAQLVQVRNATISAASTVTQGGVSYWSLTVSDGSGNLQVLLDPKAGFSSVVPGIYVAGNTFNVVGLLVPTGTPNVWMLKPRSTADLTLPVISIRAARALPPNRTVAVVGVALNGWATFADTTVHLADTSGAIRLTRLKVPPTPVTFDSIQVVATTSSRAGQPTLDAGTPTALGSGLPPTAPTLTTLVAAGAQGGALDAHLVVVNSATISDTSRSLGNFRMTVSDGSGNLTVQLDQRAGFSCQAPACTYVPPNTFDIIGVLVPTGTGSWMLKPRSSSDLVPH